MASMRLFQIVIVFILLYTVYYVNLLYEQLQCGVEVKTLVRVETGGG